MSSCMLFKSGEAGDRKRQREGGRGGRREREGYFIHMFCIYSLYNNIVT